MPRVDDLRARWHWLIPAGVIFGLLVPILFTDRTFASDWGNHMWLIWVQGLSISNLGEPSYFLQSSLGAFYPYYAFYGGSIYTVLGLVSWLGTPALAMLIGYAGALSAAYLGWTWIAVQIGVTGWRAQLPGCIAVTAPFAVTNLYGRGDVPEAIATAMLPLIAASALSMLRLPRVRIRDAAAFVSGIAVLTGTHTLTLVWGTTFLLICAAIVIACNWRAVRGRVRRGLAVSGLAVLGAGINAWIVMPLILYHTRLAEGDPDPIFHTEYTDPERLFSLFRNAGETYPEVTADPNTQLPVLALLWVLICGAVYWRFLPALYKRVAAALLAFGGGLLLLILSPSLIYELPELLRYIQFPYRVLTYVDFCLVALVTLALAAMQRDKSTATRGPVLALAAIALFNFGLSIHQNFNVRSWLSGRAEAVASAGSPPRSWYAPLQFADASEPPAEPSLPLPLQFPVERELRRSYAVTYPPGPAGTVATNVLAGPYLVDVSGARPVGRTAENKMVMRLPASRDRSRRVEIAPRLETGMTVGIWLTIVSLLASAVTVGAFAAARHRRNG